jgi:hypothetical protein
MDRQTRIISKCIDKLASCTTVQLNFFSVFGWEFKFWDVVDVVGLGAGRAAVGGCGGSGRSVFVNSSAVPT